MRIFAKIIETRSIRDRLLIKIQEFKVVSRWNIYSHCINQFHNWYTGSIETEWITTKNELQLLQYSCF